MGSLLPSNTFGGRGQELFVPVGGIEPEIDVIIEGTLTVLGSEVSLPTADLVMGLGDITAHSATLAAQVSCADLNVTDLVQCARASITGELIAGSLNLEGPLQLTNLTADSIVSAGPVSCGSLTSAGALSCGNLTSTGALSCGNLTSTGNGLITGNLIIDGSLSVTAGLPIPETVCGIVGAGPFGAGLIATVPYPRITSAGVVLLTPQTTQAQIFNGIVFSVNVVAGVGFQIYASAGAGGGLGIAWLIARL